MNPENNETRQRQSARSRVSGAVAAGTKLPHGSDSAQQGLHSVETDETAAIRDYWAAARARYMHGDYVDYGSDDWKALPIEDPRKMAGLVAFAELWRRYNPEIADDLNRQLRAPEPLWQRPTLAELNKAHDDIVNRNRGRKEAA